MAVSSRLFSLKTYGLVFAVALSPAVMQQSISCNPATGDATLSSLQVEVMGENYITAFDPEQLAYDVGLPTGADTAIVRAYSTDPNASVSYNFSKVNVYQGTLETIDSGYFPTGGGELTLDGLVPEGPSVLGIGVRAPGGRKALYTVSFAPLVCPPPAVDALGIPMACRNSFNQAISTFGVDLTVALDDCAFAGQPFNATVDPALALDTTFLEAAAQTLCPLGILMTSVDVSVLQVSVDAIAGATCTETLSELDTTGGPVTVDIPIAESPAGCDCTSIACDTVEVTGGIKVPLPQITVPCIAAGTAGSEVQLCSTGTIPLFMSLSDPSPPPAYTQTYVGVEAGGGAIPVTFSCNTSSRQNPPPGPENEIGCILPNPSPSTPSGLSCEQEVGVGNVGETPFNVSDCWTADGPPTPNQMCDLFATGDLQPCIGTCGQVPVAVDPSTVCATFPVVPGPCGVDCDDQNECTDDVCNAANGMCEHTAVADGTLCSEGRGGCYGGLCNFVPVDVTFGERELVFDWTTDRCEDLHLPDQPARFVRAADGELVLFDANAPTYYVSRGVDFDSLEPDCGPPALISSDLPTPESYENWEWIWAVYREETSWHALIHNEFHDAVAPTCRVGDPSPANPCWYNSITYAVSTNDARTFAKPMSHVVAPPPRVWTPPDTQAEYYYVEGYFNPTNIVRGPEDYYYALMGVFPESGVDLRGMCAMRTDTLSEPGSWRAWDGSGFNLPLQSPYVTGSTASLCEFLPSLERQGSGSLTYNSYLDRYMHVNDWGQWVDPQTLICGFYFTLSTDLIHWSDIQLIARADIGWCADSGGPDAPPMLEPGHLQYPSIIDHGDSTTNFERPGRTPYLYYTRHNGGLDRDLVRVPLKLTMGGPLCEGVDCDDQNACTEDVCSGADGSCEHTPIDCVDSNDCTIDACNPAIGCEYTVTADGTSCGGGLGTCQDGSCAATFSCTEQGILDAIAFGGGPHIFDCAAPTTVATTAEIVIDNDVILDGEGQLTVDGNGDHRVFSVTPGVSAGLIDLTVTRGSHSDVGGGVLNGGTLSLTDVMISGNTAGHYAGLLNDGTATLIRTTVVGNQATSGSGGGIGNGGTITLIDTIVADNQVRWHGGGIAQSGTMELINSTVSSNTAVFGGGIWNFGGSLVLTNSAVSGNSTTSAGGGGIANEASLKLVDTTVAGNQAAQAGGGIANRFDGTLTLANTTVYGNTATYGGGIENQDAGTLTAVNTTVSSNAATDAGGGGIANGATMTLVSTTFAMNSAAQVGTAISNTGWAAVRNTLIAGDPIDFVGRCWFTAPLNSLGGNIEVHSDTCGLDHPTDQVNTPYPWLGPLADNGGPTRTHALLPDGWVADQIPAADCVDADGAPLTTDQRGEPRPVAISAPEPRCDVGAFEVQP